MSLPIRAIPSNLALRTSPTIPLSAQAYEPLVKSVLAHRLTYRIFAYSAAFTWIQTSCWSIWAMGGMKSLGFSGTVVLPFSPFIVAVSLVSWAAVALPLILLRKAHLTANRTIGSSPSKTMQLNLANSRTQHTLATYVASALALTTIHVALSYMNDDPRLRVFVKSRKHPYYLNGRLTFLLLSQATLSIACCLRNIMLDRFVFPWAKINPVAKWPFSIVDILRTGFVVTVLTTFSVASSTLLFAFARIVIIPLLFKLPILPIFLRPFMAHFIKGPWTFTLIFRHFPLVVRAWFLGATTLATWEMSEMVFDSFVCQPIRISSDNAVALVAGISSPDRIFKIFAYSDLKNLATDDSSAGSARRTALFGDQKYTPSLWSQLMRETLLLLGHDYDHFLRRGKPAPPKPAPVPPVPQNTPASTPISLLKKPIYQTAKQSPIRSVIDSLSSDGSIALAVDASAEAAHIPELFKSVAAVVSPEPAREEIKKGAENARKFVSISRIQAVLSSFALRHTPAPLLVLGASWSDWWYTDRLGKVVEACVPARELDVLAIEVLSKLVCASLEEDRYGVVQRDMPKIIEALLSFLSAVEEYQLEINAKYVPPDASLSQAELHARELLRLEVVKAADALGLLSIALKEGIADIARTFGGKLQAFKFPPRTAAKLQGFLDYASPA
ncbi:nucleoporin protein Ndc1-Nup [Mycena floridula]|nr:nucleoporin protein Ndc1-Nup [Mycena floridula]